MNHIIIKTAISLFYKNRTTLGFWAEQIKFKKNQGKVNKVKNNADHQLKLLAMTFKFLIAGWIKGLIYVEVYFTRNKLHMNRLLQWEVFQFI